MESGQNVSRLILLVCVGPVKHMFEKDETLKKESVNPFYVANSSQQLKLTDSITGGRIWSWSLMVMFTRVSGTM